MFPRFFREHLRFRKGIIKKDNVKPRDITLKYIYIVLLILGLAPCFEKEVLSYHHELKYLESLILKI